MQGVVVADVLHHLAQGLHVVGVLPILHHLAKEVAEDAAEVLVTGVAQKAAGVGEHAVETADGTVAHQAQHLLLHALLVVVEPPGRALLDLAGDGAVGLETAHDGADDAVVGGIERI